jgi:hypothetical protein
MEFRRGAHLRSKWQPWLEAMRLPIPIYSGPTCRFVGFPGRSRSRFKAGANGGLHYRPIADMKRILDRR